MPGQKGSSCDVSGARRCAHRRFCRGIACDLRLSNNNTNRLGCQQSGDIRLPHRRDNNSFATGWALVNFAAGTGKTVAAQPFKAITVVFFIAMVTSDGFHLPRRFKAILVEKDSCLLQLCRYIVQNAVAANPASTVEEWLWSSCRATASITRVL